MLGVRRRCAGWQDATRGDDQAAAAGPRDGVANFAHHDPGSTGFNIDAFVALAEPGLAGAGQRRERALHHANH